MPRYLKLVAPEVLVSENSDYSDAEVSPKFQAYSLTPDEVIAKLKTVGSGAAEDIQYDGLSAISLLVVQNLDTTNYVTVNIRTAGDSAVRATRIQPGGVFMTTDVGIASQPTIQANTAACRVKILLAGTA